ncbi:MAG: 3-isopropylmalate dehydratase small subunit [Saprospiraceae bacterium]|nr:3-isopropylmalate dehydratase small subunit [Saprospiraceae bacterium]
MEPFKSLISTAVPLPVEHVDTDQIIPARFLKMVTKRGFGEQLFRDWRYHRDGQPNADFVLNNPVYRGEILVAGHNFGCGSSREHAAWALVQYGFRVVVSSEFADIFKNNALNNGLLTVEVTPEVLHEVFSVIERSPAARFEIDLPEQRFTILETGQEVHFEINPFKKQCLVRGMDELDYLLSLDQDISAFEQRQITFA